MKNKILFSILAVLFILLLSSGTAFAADPIEIRTFEELMAINNPENLSKSYILMDNIDLTGKPFVPIGTDSDWFTGTFNGNGYIISNLTFSDEGMTGVGLFGCSDGAEFSNITLDNISVIGDMGVGSLLGFGDNTTIQFCSVDNSVVTGNEFVGGLVGVMFSSSADSNYVVCTVNGNDGSGNVGGFAGYLFTSSSISNSSATGNVIGSGNVGGFVGHLELSSSVSDSFAKGTVKGDHVGGFVGNMSASSSVSTSYAAVDVVGNNDGAGGFVGVMSGSSSVSESYATGNVVGIRFVGGFVGDMTSSSVSDSYATGDAKGTGDFVGGFVGGMEGMGGMSIITNSYATGNAVENVDEVGGFVGKMHTSDEISGSFYIGTPDSNDNDKGVFIPSSELKTINTFKAGNGYVLDDWDISPSPNSTHIWYIIEGKDYPRFYWSYQPQTIYVNESNFRYIGSSVCKADAEGEDKYWTMKDNYILTENVDMFNVISAMGDTDTYSPIGTELNPFTGTFDGNGYIISNLTFSDDTMDYVGLFGYAKGAEFSNIHLENISMTGQDNVGSFVGRLESSSVSDSYATGTVTGEYYVGGFVGSMVSSSISNSSETGDAKGLVSVGGFVGSMYDSSISNSFATGDVEGEQDIGGFVGFMESDSSISDSYATGDAKGVVVVGGFVSSMSSSSFISNSYATGDAKGVSEVGGFVGYMVEGSSISNSYATGDAEGNDMIGGFVGSICDSDISNSYATGTVTGESYVGGFVGNLDTSSTITDSFYIGSPDSNNTLMGLFVTSDELKQISTFKTVGSYLSGPWDISSSPDPVYIWYINEGHDSPKFFWSYQMQPSVPSPDKPDSSGSGTGSANVVNNTSTQDNTTQDNTTQNNTTQNNTTQNNTTQNNTTQNNTMQNNTSDDSTEQNSNSLIWWGLGIILLIAIVGGIVVLYFKKK